MSTRARHHGRLAGARSASGCSSGRAGRRSVAAGARVRAKAVQLCRWARRARAAGRSETSGAIEPRRGSARLPHLAQLPAERDALAQLACYPVEQSRDPRKPPSPSPSPTSPHPPILSLASLAARPDKRIRLRKGHVHLPWTCVKPAELDSSTGPGLSPRLAGPSPPRLVRHLPRPAYSRHQPQPHSDRSALARATQWSPFAVNTPAPARPSPGPTSRSRPSTSACRPRSLTATRTKW